MPQRLSKIFRKEKSTIISSFGKKRELKDSVKDRTKGKTEEPWPTHNGKEKRYREIFFDILKREPISFLIKRKNKNPDIMIIGPGKGLYISELYQELTPYGIKPKIDVLGLQKTIDRELLDKKIVAKDFSSGKALEEISQDSRNNKSIIKQIKERYDLVVAPASAGLHTLYPAFNVFNISCMLKKGGVAYIEIPTPEVIKRPKFGVPEEHRTRMINQFSRLPQIVSKFLENYKGREYSREFNFSNIDYFTIEKNLDGTKTKTPKRYIKVERK